MFTFEDIVNDSLNSSELHKIISELKSGNNTCLKKIFIEHADYCIANLKKKTGCSHEDAEDILTDAVVNFREKAISGKIEYLTNIRNYLLSTCYNMWLAQYKKMKSLQNKLPAIKHQYDSDELEDNHLREDMIQVLHTTLNRIDTKCQRILTYFYLEKRKMSEIAECLGFSSADVAKMSKSRCLKKLMAEVKITMKEENVQL